ncbi:tyrosyl-DNA phosphodiesterase 2 isoform X2 [Carassius auratus]|uniref:Tyrosyl-DNA phosphodiesterase 2 n=1 Tax=Carassius auratus TaxID=7957 RepID=A0A6P6LKI0_CARAU|nr:tyrosyl-DNA phosphodiesterase 2-like isoform X2 [Carassius auratus]
MDETTCSSHTCSRELLVYCSDTAPCLVDTIVKGKTRKKNKKGKKRQSAACQMKTDSECTLVTAEQLSPSQHLPEHLEKRSAGSKNKKKSQKTRIILPATSQASSAYQEEPSGSQKASAQSACDQSTQTESPQLQSFQTLSTQTPPIQGIHSPPTESKSTQTKHSSFPLQQAYWGRSFTDQSTDEQETQSSSRNRHLTVLSWNIDCLDSENISHRVKGLLSQFGKYRADVVLLQELVPGCLTILQNIMKDYQVLQGSEDGYFTAILLRKDRVQLLQSNIVKYPTTEMGRNLLIAHVKKLGGLPYGISDVWEMLGEPEESKYTWDTSINDNKEIPHSICLRFDRLFLRAAAEGAQLRPESMTLIGLEKLKCDYFISDHWGILCTFKFEASEEQRVND